MPKSRPFRVAGIFYSGMYEYDSKFVYILLDEAQRFFNVKGVSIPVAVSVFPSEQYPAPRSWTEQAYPNLIYFNEVDRGGHYAAWEQPGLFSSELWAAFRSLR